MRLRAGSVIVRVIAEPEPTDAPGPAQNKGFADAQKKPALEGAG